MQFTYEARMQKEFDEQGNPDGFTVTVPQFPGTVAAGATVAEACKNAAECLRLVLAEYLDEGRQIPEPVFGDEPGTVLSVEVTSEFLAKSRCLTVGEAAEELGISRSRVSQLLNNGMLDCYVYGTERLVTIASVNDRKKNPPAPHRPKKDR